MKKLLHIVPHLSTGGAPTYAYQRLKSLFQSQQYNIKVVEYQNLSNDYVVQKNLIKNLLGEKNVVTLNENKSQLLDLIINFDPNVISLEEIPELFMDMNLARQIYLKPNRHYKLIETTHNSEFEPSRDKILLPDYFVFVSQYSQIKYSVLNIPSEVIEYPVDVLTISNPQSLLNQNYKNIIITGLFSPRKNQKYAFELAQKLVNYPIRFHFLGNTADNFKFYWEPLLKDKPNNCIIHGESDKVKDFLMGSDLFLFPSLGNNSDRELHPIAIKEALSCNLPILLFPLDVYLGKYNENPNVFYLSGNVNEDALRIVDLLKLTNKPINEILNNFISLEFNKEENRIYIKSIYSQNIFIKNCVVKELNSEVPIYYLSNCTLWQNGNIWINPLNNFSFDNDSFCSGFIIEFYNEKGGLFFHKTIQIKPLINLYKPKNLDPFDCCYVNYREFFALDVYENFNLENLEVVIDIGSNVGLFSQYILEKGAKRVVALEPIPKAFQVLKRLDATGKALSLDLALDVSTGLKEIFFREDNTTISRFVEKVESPENNYEFQKLLVKTISWEDLIIQYNIDKISLLKLDIESHEYVVFPTLTSEHLNKIDKIILEYHFNFHNEIEIITNKLIANNFNFKFFKQGSSEEVIGPENNGVIFAWKTKK